MIGASKLARLSQDLQYTALESEPEALSALAEQLVTEHKQVCEDLVRLKNEIIRPGA